MIKSVLKKIFTRLSFEEEKTPIYAAVPNTINKAEQTPIFEIGS